MNEYLIKRLGHLGDGIADGPAGDIYAPFTLPGETVTGELAQDRIDVPKIVTPSADRVKPPCAHFKTCGGCSLQHASDAFLAGWKQDIVAQALKYQGIEVDFLPIHISPPSSRRRATLSGRKTKKSAMVGFHGRASDTIVDIPGCTLLRAEILAARDVLVGITRLGATRKSNVSLAVTHGESGLDVSVSDAREMDRNLFVALGELIQNTGIARLSWNGEVALSNTPPIQRFDGLAVVPPAGSFLQATEQGQAALLRDVQDIAGGVGQLVDLFAGCGTFALPLARNAEVDAVEGDAEALAALDAAWRGGEGLKKVETFKRDLFRNPLDDADLAPYEAAVIDPPRAGAEEQCRHLAQSQIARIAFVSCNPVTFARDAAILIAGGYKLDQIRVVDQFRWSPHTELVAGFSR